MSAHKTRDIAILAAVGIVVVVLLLTERESRDPAEGQDEQQRTAAEVGTKSAVAGKEEKREDEYVNPGADAPIEGVPHRYFPLVVGSKWIYRVDGPERFVPHPTWTMTLLKAPDGEQPGTLQAGFGGALKEMPIWLDKGAVRLSGLPFVEPIEYLGNSPLKTTGEFLPLPERIGEGAVWVQEMSRELTHQYRDNQGKIHSTTAEARQRDRAQVTELDEVTVPAGHFQALRISWLSRIDIKAAGRPILKDVTSEPFKKETMWIVAGLGIVRRRIDYAGYRGVVLSFDLVQYKRRAAHEPALQ